MFIIYFNFKSGDCSEESFFKDFEKLDTNLTGFSQKIIMQFKNIRKQESFL